jgi:hypothetical protein
MPNRNIVESICTSDTLAQLSAEAERFFYRILVKCDDYGRYDARPNVLRAHCFTMLLDAITEADVQRWLLELTTEPHAVLYIYHVGERPYLQVINWEAYQQVRAVKSKWPNPPAEPPPPSLFDLQMGESDNNCNQLQADVLVNVNEYVNDIAFNEPAATAAPTQSLEKVASPRTPTKQQEVVGALATICQMNTKIPSHASRMGKTATALLKGNCTTDDVTRFLVWWLSDPWRAKNTPVPTLSQVEDKIAQAKIASVSSNGNGAHASTAPPMSQAQKTMEDKAIEQVLAREAKIRAGTDALIPKGVP